MFSSKRLSFQICPNCPEPIRLWARVATFYELPDILRVTSPNLNLYFPCFQQPGISQVHGENRECYFVVEKSCYARRAATRPVLLRKPTNLEGAIIIPSTGEQRRKAATAACCSSIN